MVWMRGQDLVIARIYEVDALGCRDCAGCSGATMAMPVREIACPRNRPKGLRIPYPCAGA